MTHTVFLTTPENCRLRLYLQKVTKGSYAVTGAEGYATIDGHTLAFDLEHSSPQVRNLDFSSDMFSCFGLSEALEMQGFVFRSGNGAPTFEAANLRQLQAGLNLLRGSFINNDEL